MGWKAKTLGYGGLATAAVGVPAVGTAMYLTPYNSRFPKDSYSAREARTPAQQLRQSGYYSTPPRTLQRTGLRKMAKDSETKSKITSYIKDILLKEANLAMAPRSVMPRAAPKPSEFEHMRLAIGEKGIPGFPTNSTVGKPMNSMVGAPGAANPIDSGLTAMASTTKENKRELVKRAFLSKALPYLSHWTGRAGIGAGTSTLAGGDPFTGALIGGIMPGPASAAAVGTAGGLTSSALRFRNRKHGLPPEQEAHALGQVNTSRYHTPMWAITSPA